MGVSHRESADVLGDLRCDSNPGLCVSHSSPSAYHTSPLPSCVALGRLLTSLCFRLAFCKTKLTQGSWEGSEETIKEPGVPSVPTSLVSPEHLET